MDHAIFSVVVVGVFGVLHKHFGARGGTKRVFRVGWVIILALLACAFAFVRREGLEERARLQALVEGMAPTYAGELSLMGHADIHPGTPPDDPRYLKMIEAEKRWLDVNRGVADIYTFRRLEDGRTILVVDSETDYDHNGVYEGEREARTAIGEVYEEVDPELDIAFTGKEIFAPNPVTDRWGTWVSAYVPMRDAEGRVDAVLGVDYDARSWVESEKRARRKAIALVAVPILTVMGAITTIALLRSNYEAQVRMDAALRAESRRFQALIEKAEDIILALSPEGSIQYRSPSMPRLLEYANEDDEPTAIEEIVHPDDRNRLLDTLTRLARDHTMTCVCEVRFKRADGEWRTFECLGSNHLNEPALQALVLNCRDITERKEIERLKDELVSTVSHELRTPLTSLRGFAELMLTRRFDEDKRTHFISIIHDESCRLTTLINSFLDIQRMESGRQGYNFVSISLHEILEHTAGLFTPNDNGVDIRIDPAIAGLLVRADADRLKQVLANLLSNAVKYSPGGGEVSIRADIQGEFVAVSIADQGIGMPQEAIPRLFHKFYRVDQPSARNIGGTGLGLALVKEIVQAHGGSIHVESTPGVGSTFRFTLKRAPATEGDADADADGIAGEAHDAERTGPTETPTESLAAPPA